MTPKTHNKYAAAAGSFFSVTTENGVQQDICNLIIVPCVQRSLYVNEVTDDFGNIDLEKRVGTMCDYLRKSSRNKSQNEIPRTCTFDSPGASNHHQNSTRRPENGAGQGKKRAKIFGPPTLRAPTLRGPHPSGPPFFSGFGHPPFGSPILRDRTDCETTETKMDWPNMDWPKMDWPKMDWPKMDCPKLDCPKLDLAKNGLSHPDTVRVVTSYFLFAHALMLESS